MALEQKILDELKGKLVEEKTKLENDLQRIANPTGTPGDYETKFEDLGTDSDENATEVEEYADKLALENDLEKQLKDVLDALKRMEDGSYGFCENCQQDIDIDRLRAYPAARTCIKC
ncbi:MAG: TraR/DksA C4-type zinc finger protein [Candidatus Moranbacteria bacterium]|jgi:RNA polymerase-binding transcription factor DksA|nr:TraR/DksA C4-type zinc finger protein [Candidatus Moranbacteria bacterium]